MDRKYLLIGFAALFGTSLRALVSVLTAGADFPYSTLAINAIASFALVVLYEAVRKHELLPPLAITAIGTGLIGSFSTMSAVAYDTAGFIRSGQYLLAGANYTLNMVLCLLGAVLGLFFARMVMSTRKGQEVAR